MLDCTNNRSNLRKAKMYSVKKEKSSIVASFRIDRETWERFIELMNKYGLNASAALKFYVNEVLSSEGNESNDTKKMLTERERIMALLRQEGEKQLAESVTPSLKALTDRARSG